MTGINEADIDRAPHEEWPVASSRHTTKRGRGVFRQAFLFEAKTSKCLPDQNDQIRIAQSRRNALIVASSPWSLGSRRTHADLVNGFGWQRAAAPHDPNRNGYP